LFPGQYACRLGDNPGPGQIDQPGFQRGRGHRQLGHQAGGERQVHLSGPHGHRQRRGQLVRHEGADQFREAGAGRGISAPAKTRGPAARTCCLASRTQLRRHFRIQDAVDVARAAAGQLGDGGQFPGRRPGSNPPPGPHDAGQLIITGVAQPVHMSGIGHLRQHRARTQHVQDPIGLKSPSRRRGRAAALTGQAAGVPIVAVLQASVRGRRVCPGHGGGHDKIQDLLLAQITRAVRGIFTAGRPGTWH
jgi:hypothetical protein